MAYAYLPGSTVNATVVVTERAAQTSLRWPR